MEQMTFSLFFQSLINGLNQGAIYALIALGYTMVYGIIRMINFAHGDFIMIGAYTLFYTIPLMVNAGMPAWLSVIVAIAVCALVGVLVETFAYRPVRKAGPMSALITALAMSIFLENLAMVLFGAKPHNVQAIFSLSTITVGSVALPLNVLLTIAIGLGIMIALQLFVKKTKLGKAMRAVPQDKDASILVGINVNRIITTTFCRPRLPGRRQPCATRRSRRNDRGRGHRHCAGLADGGAGYRTGRRRQHRNPAGRFRLRPRRRPQSPLLRAKNLRRPPCRRDSSCSILIVGRKQDGE